MTNPTDSKQQYEGAILQQLIKNSERLAVIENDVSILKNDVSTLKNDVSILKNDSSTLKNDVSKIENDLAQVQKTLKDAKSWLIAIFIGIIVNIISQPVLSFF